MFAYTFFLFIIELKYLSNTCEFGKFLDEAVRDRFVCGLYDDDIQKRLLSEKIQPQQKRFYTTAAAWEMTNMSKEQS